MDKVDKILAKGTKGSRTGSGTCACGTLHDWMGNGSGSHLRRHRRHGVSSDGRKGSLIVGGNSGRRRGHIGGVTIGNVGAVVGGTLGNVRVRRCRRVVLIGGCRVDGA